MSKTIFFNLLTIFKYQLFGIKMTADSAFYCFITLHPILGLFDVMAFFSLIFHTFITLPLAFLFNISILALVWVFDNGFYIERLQLVEKAYVEAATRIKDEYNTYINTLHNS